MQAVTLQLELVAVELVEPAQLAVQVAEDILEVLLLEIHI